MRLKVNALLPCVTFFAAGRVGMGAAALAMQASLFFWPTACRKAREFSESQAVDRMLTSLSETYQLPLAPPRKRFSTAAGFGAQPAAARPVRQAAWEIVSEAALVAVYGDFLRAGARKSPVYDSPEQLLEQSLSEYDSFVSKVETPTQ